MAVYPVMLQYIAVMACHGFSFMKDTASAEDKWDYDYSKKDNRVDCTDEGV